MLKIPINTVASALQPTRGKADNLLRRFLVPSMSQLEISSSRGNNCRYSYHSFSQQNSEVSTEKQMTLPPNLMFDFKSSFAPQKDEIAPVLEEADEESESGDEASEYDFDDEEIK